MLAQLAMNPAQARLALSPGFDPYAGHADTGGFFSSIAHAVSSAAKVVANPLKATEYIGKGIGQGAVLAAKGAAAAGKFAYNKGVKPAVANALPVIQTVLKNTGPIGMVASGAIGAMKAGLTGHGLEDIAWAAAEGAAPTGIDKAISAAQSIRHGGNVITNAVNVAAQSFAPGSPEHLGYESAIGVLKSTGSKAALGVARRALPSEGAKRAFDAAIGVVSKVSSGSALLPRAAGIPNIVLSRVRAPLSALHPNLQMAVDTLRRNPGAMTIDPRLLAGRMGTSTQLVNDALKRVGTSALPWRSFSPNAAMMVQRNAGNIPAMWLKALHHNTAGLDQTGTKYVVEAGDYPTRIAQKLTGNANRWKELLPANPRKPVAKTGKFAGSFATLNAGEVLNLPSSWQKPNPSTSSIPTPTPTLKPDPSAPQPAQSSTTVNAAAAGILQGKATLIAWGNTDGSKQAGVSDYGLQAADLSPVIGPRDSLEISSFQNWANANPLAVGGVRKLSGGNMDAETLSALQSWAELKANPIATQVVPVTVDVPSNTTVTPAPVPAGVPAKADGSSALPSVADKSAPATASSGSSLPMMAAGAVGGGLLFGPVGAIVGAGLGAAIS